ncbi:uroporphyrinogen-III C-methyltransferase [uncultured Shewanella sp.]|uniref:uroporphyrinogen-III C-methyltransferase n=1 Tax=Shewanella atlantica TaxID=271099 RepID=UPI0026332CC2|nr:uroporphyrinogen-III C-methyltransferase [uncultured Shewanella sp.]
MDNKKLDENVIEPKTEVSSETDTHDTTQAVSEPQEESANIQPETEKNSVSPGFIFNLFFILVVAFGALGGGYYLYQELVLQQQKSQALATELKQALSEPARQISSLQREQQEFSGSITRDMKGLTDSQTQLNERVAKLAQRNPNHWMAEEAKYLVRMAGSKLWLEKDPSTAASLLKSADDRIESMKDPSLTPLRKALAQDIASVSAIKSTDIAGTVLSLDSIIENLHQLPLNRADVANAAKRIESPEMSESLDDWRSNLAKSWQALMDDFVVVRKRTTDSAPLLKPDQQWYLVENIRNKLLQSQLALYRKDQVNYRQSLTLARKWIYQYFDLNSPRTEETLATLDALSTLEIQTASINHFKSTALLQQLVLHGNVMVNEEPSL